MRVTEFDLPRSAWRRSTYCGSSGACVEVAVLDDQTIAMRSSAQPERPVLIFAPEAWISFLGSLRAGHQEEDIPSSRAADSPAGRANDWMTPKTRS
ncbi:DUF397 domain-containing protein [Nonomuraea typhae]|uniref:DUF397 domain-containing protein n=1 Tax=Nonomuraea typhae TaxID=2603600 RepID=UPI0012F7B6FC|nr:DUF397 domain-containing protein [Nonomuraea typhae]